MRRLWRAQSTTTSAKMWSTRIIIRHSSSPVRTTTWVTIKTFWRSPCRSLERLKRFPARDRVITKGTSTLNRHIKEGLSPRKSFKNRIVAIYGRSGQRRASIHTISCSNSNREPPVSGPSATFTRSTMIGLINTMTLSKSVSSIIMIEARRTRQIVTVNNVHHSV